LTVNQQTKKSQELDQNQDLYQYLKGKLNVNLRNIKRSESKIS